MDEQIRRHTLRPGTVLRSNLNTYTVERVLGAGGFGITYLVSASVMVRNISVKAYFAVKEHFLSEVSERESDTAAVRFLSTAQGKVENSLRDFISEATRLASFGKIHENIVKVNEVFMANNTAYYVMQYVEGQSLADYIKSRGRLDIHETLKLMTPVITAVGALHKERLTHLDIKPDNIMLEKTDDGIRPILIDFGLAKHYDEGGSPTSSINTLGYSNGFSPIEQYGGITSYSPTADIYALAATLYNCLTGEPPKRATEIHSIDAVAAPLSRFASEDLVQAICHGMEPDTTRRTQAAMQLLREVEGAAGIQTDKPLPPPPATAAGEDSGATRVLPSTPGAGAPPQTPPQPVITPQAASEQPMQSGSTIMLDIPADAKPAKHFPIVKVLIIGLVAIVVVIGIIFAISSASDSNADDTEETTLSESSGNSSSEATSADIDEAISLYENGKYEQAAAMFAELAEQGNSDAQFNLGLCYFNGQGVPQSHDEAVTWFRKSAEQDNPLGQFQLGLCYQDGTGVPQSYEDAAKWYKLSADQGDPDATSNLAYLYYNGLGVKQDIAEAKRLWKIAAAAGDEAAIENLKGL